MDVFSLALEMKTASKSVRLYYPNSQKLERVGKSTELDGNRNVKKRVQKKGAQMSEEALSLFSFRRKM